MTDQHDRLYGLPGAERLEFDIGSVYETCIDGQLEGNGPWTIEEHLVRPTIDSVPTAERIVGDILELTSEDDYTEDPFHERVYKDPELLALAEALRTAVAGKVTWFMAGEKVATHTITLVETDDPKYPTVLLDGEPMYVPRQLTREELLAITDRQLTPAEILRCDPMRTCELEDGTQLNGYAAMEQWQKLAAETP